ncbi:MAG: glycosyltransferase [Opitutaceae bacterium]|nr:glycosyltransferase [Opitutaceae bacterium]
MARIRILIGSHLCTNTRALREARALVEAGHDVSIQGVWYDKALVARDESLLLKAPYHFEPVVNLCRRGLLPRLRRRLGVESWRRLKRFSPSSLGYGVREHLRAARAAEADLTIAHSEGTMWVAAQLASKGLRVGIDFENWFSEVIRPEERARRPVETLRALEHKLLHTARYRLAPSRAMARALGERAGVEPPHCVYNAFPLAELNAPAPPVSDRKHRRTPSLHWFSSRIGPGRGLTALLGALPHLQYPVEIHLRGELQGADRKWFAQLMPPEWRDRLFIHSTVHNSEMLPRIASHDIGLALESGATVGRDLTIAKKTFHYMWAGLAVVASDTSGHKEIAEQSLGAMKLVPPDNPVALAEAIDAWLAFPEHLALARQAAVKATKETFCWELVREQLLDELALALAND